MLLQIAKLGNPILRCVADPVRDDEFVDPAFIRLIDDMVATMRDSEGVGLAAPQVFVSKQLCVLEIRAEADEPAGDALPLLVMINPEITPVTDLQIEVWEGCLSIENLRGKVRRYAAVEARFQDRQGVWQQRVLEGYAAVVAQHETDHLVGKLYLDRLHDTTMLAHQREFERYCLSEAELVD